jgi:hypothetical protein
MRIRRQALSPARRASASSRFSDFSYGVNFLDRVNVGYADLGVAPEIFGFGVGSFFAGYILCEIPSTSLT